MGLDHQRVERKPSATACSPWPSTLLILDIKVPSADVEKSGLWLSLGHAWPNYLAYAISFLTIGVMWVNHHTLLSMVKKVDHALLYRKILLLGVVSFIPFPTAVLSEYVHGAGADDMRAAVGLYGLAMIGLGAAFTVMWAHLYRQGDLGQPGIDRATVHKGLIRSAGGTLTYVVATAIALVAPVVTLLIFALLVIGFALTRPPSAR